MSTLAERVRVAVEAIESARIIKLAAFSDAGGIEYQATREAHTELFAIKNKYKDAALAIADPPDECERCRDRQRRPDTTWIDDAGFHFRWDADHPNDIRDEFVPWNLLESEPELSEVAG